ncbi:MAG: rRNA maturation RNase YbeY [Candidatus Omnitrophica bacterium]|nr:rRNA maturation RNase YbeY [Candidatus Omnitrophota bacterium]
MAIKSGEQGAGSRESLHVSLSPKGEGSLALDTHVICIAARDMLKKCGVRRARLSIVLLSDKAMRALNKKALGHDYVTDVITFDLSSDVLEGEIYVCPGEAKRNAALYGEPVERELLRYVAHGILHLSGFDDASDKERLHMRIEEDRLLKSCS